MSEHQEEPSGKSSRHRVKLVMLAGALGIAALVGYKWWWSQGHVTTDNAQVEGRIVPVLPKVGGFIAEVSVADHQAVKAGDLLARIDDRDYRARLAQAEAELQLAIANAGREGQSGLASAQLAAARASAAAARSTVEQALANADRAQKDLERTRGLVEKKMVSPQQLDAAESAARAALAQVQASRQSAASAGEQVTATNAALRAALAKVDAARATRDLAAQQLADTRILAPADGVASSKNMEPGQLVQAGQPLVSVVPLDDVWVIANLKETDVRDVKPGVRAEIKVDAYPGAKLAGQVASVSPATGARFTLLPPDNATGNFTKVVQRIPVKILVKQGDDPLRPLRPGMSVEVTLATR
ncbi:MAG: HlyD family secretion protein [Rhodocyclaceae bacterium]|jgi:membrane fusion protein (multidrug efflux system)|nr:HlyD family secretion protein [Rhodocyclaceae bacterium]